MRAKCAFCPFSTNHNSLLIQHMCRKHKGNFEIQCYYRNCRKNFVSWNAFKNHLSYKHRRRVNEVVENVTQSELDSDSDLSDTGCEEMDADTSEEHQDETLEPDFTYNTEEVERVPLDAHMTVKFLVDLQEQRKLTRTSLEAVMAGTNKLALNLGNSLKARLTEVLEDENICNVAKTAVDEIMGVDLFEEIDTKYKLNKYLEHNCGLVKPTKIILGYKWIWKRLRNNKQKLVHVKITCHIVPFRQALQKLLSNHEILQCVINSKQSTENDPIRDFNDGEIFKINSILKREKQSLLPFLYLDEIQVANPLGAKTKSHKYMMIYWSLGNLPPHIRSSLKSINLVGIVKYIDMKEFGLKPVLQDFLDGIMELESEQGMELDINGQQLTFHGTLLMVCCDTPAANSIGGFKEGVATAHRPCRCCMVTHAEIQTQHYIKDLKMRNKDMHQAHCIRIENPENTKQSRTLWSKLYGVNSTSILSCLVNFDITKCLVQDFMHIVLEGVIPLEIKSLLNSCITEGIINLQVINSRIVQFPYPVMYNTDKPSQIEPQHLQDGHGLRQYAVQNLCLLRCLPFILQDLLPPQDPRLKNMILLSQIVNFCLAFEISKNDIPTLEAMIILHNTRFREIYPEVPLTPKCHYLMHLPNHILQFGLLRHQWCLRFEASHQYYKEIARITKNFKNLSYTLSQRQQVKTCMELGYGDPFYKFITRNELQVHEGSVLSLSGVKCGLEISTLLNIELDTYVVKANTIKAKSVTYKISDILLIRNDDEEMPSFGKIHLILMYQNHVIFVVRELKVNSYLSNVNAYKVDQSEEYSPVVLSALTTSQVFPEFINNGESFIMLHNHTRVEFYG